MYRNQTIYPAGGTNTSKWAAPKGQSHGIGLDEVVGKIRLSQPYYRDTLQAFAALVEAGKTIEMGQSPPFEQFELIVPELNELRLTAIYLRKQVEKGAYPQLRAIVPHIEKYAAMAMQHAQAKGYLQKPNNESFIGRKLRAWDRERNPKTRLKPALAKT